MKKVDIIRQEITQGATNEIISASKLAAFLEKFLDIPLNKLIESEVTESSKK